MNRTIESKNERIADAATDKADDLSFQLNRLTGLVKLAAFAVEARRYPGCSGATLDVNDAAAGEALVNRIVTDLAACRCWSTRQRPLKQASTAAWAL